MSIVFGWYSLKIKSYKPEELGFNNEQLPDTTFEVRQRIVHLFWIPVFGIGKFYAVRKHGILLDIPEAQKNLMRSKGRHRAPWYSFSLLILLVVGYITFLAYEKYKVYDRQNRRKASFEKSIIQLDKEFSSLDTNCYLKLRDPHNYSNSEGTYLKLVEADGRMVNGKLLHTGLKHYQKDEVKNYFRENYNNLETYILSMEDIRNGVCRDLSRFNNYSCPGVNLLQDENEYYIESVERF